MGSLNEEPRDTRPFSAPSNSSRQDEFVLYQSRNNAHVGPAGRKVIKVSGEIGIHIVVERAGVRWALLWMRVKHPYSELLTLGLKGSTQYVRLLECDVSYTRVHITF